MAFTCPKCGWKHKASQEKYAQSRGLSQPVCEDCNPSLKQKISAMRKAFIISAFSDSYMGYGPLASIPYVPLVLLFSAAMAYVTQGAMAVFLSIFCLLAGYVSNSCIATKVGDSIRYRLLRGQPICFIILGYYAPLILIMIGSVIFWWAY